MHFPDDIRAKWKHCNFRNNHLEHDSPVCVSVDNPGPPLWSGIDQLDRPLQRFPGFSHNAVPYLDTGHSPGEAGRSVPVGDVSDQFQAQLPGVQHPPKSLCTGRTTWGEIKKQLFYF